MKYLVKEQINKPTSQLPGFNEIENSVLLMKELMQFVLDMHSQYAGISHYVGVFTSSEQTANERKRRLLTSFLKNKAILNLLIFLDTKEEAQFVR